MSGSKTATGGAEPTVLVRRLTEADHAAWRIDSQALWMGTDSTTRAAEDLTLFIEPERFGALRYDALVAVADGRGVGFVEVSLRDDFEAFGGLPVGYVEGIFVEIAYRGRGVGHTLIAAAAAWTESAGASELASDVVGDNPASLAFHRAVGFSVIQEGEADGQRHVLLARRL